MGNGSGPIYPWRSDIASRTHCADAASAKERQPNGSPDASPYWALKATIRRLPDLYNLADDQHADHQLGIDRWPTNLAVERAQFLAQLGQINEAVDRSQQVVGRNMTLE